MDKIEYLMERMEEWGWMDDVDGLVIVPGGQGGVVKSWENRRACWRWLCLKLIEFKTFPNLLEFLYTDWKTEHSASLEEFLGEFGYVSMWVHVRMWIKE